MDYTSNYIVRGRFVGHSSDGCFMLIIVFYTAEEYSNGDLPDWDLVTEEITNVMLTRLMPRTAPRIAKVLFNSFAIRVCNYSGTEESNIDLLFCCGIFRVYRATESVLEEAWSDG